MPLWLLALLGATYLARIAPRMIRPHALSADTYYHLLAADRIREERFRLPTRLRGLCFPGVYDYPPLFHYLLALWPRGARERVEPHVNAVLDTLMVGLFYVAARSLLAGAVSRAEEAALVAAGLFAMSPVLLSVGTGPRAFTATPRVLGELLFYVAIFATGMWTLEGAGWGLVVAVLAGAGTLLTSRFGAQALLFVVPLVAAMAADPRWLLIPPLALGVALVVSGGHYLTVLRNHGRQLWLYHRLGADRAAVIFGKTSWRDLPAVMRRALTDPRRALQEALWRNCVLVMATRNLHLLAVLPFAFALPPSSWLRLCLFWVVASVIAFGLTSLRPLMILGEPERYVEFSLPASILVLVALWWTQPMGGFVLGAAAAWSLLLSAIAVYVFVRIHAPQDRVSRARGEMLDRLQTSPGPLRVLPFFEAPYSLAYRCGQEIFYPPGNFQLSGPDEYRRLYEGQGVPNRDSLAYIVARYGVNTFLVNQRYRAERGYPEPSLPTCEKLFENEQYTLYRVGTIA